MFKKCLTVFLTFNILCLPLHSLSNELATLTEECCHKVHCECDHKESSSLIIRNVRCGDNGSNEESSSTFRQSLLISSFKLVPIEYESLFRIIKSKLIMDYICNLDPPPPKPIV